MLLHLQNFFPTVSTSSSSLDIVSATVRRRLFIEGPEVVTKYEAAEVDAPRFTTVVGVEVEIVAGTAVAVATTKRSKPD